MRGWDCNLRENHRWNRVSRIFPKTAWRVVCDRQATHALNPVSGYQLWTAWRQRMNRQVARTQLHCFWSFLVFWGTCDVVVMSICSNVNCNVLIDCAYADYVGRHDFWSEIGGLGFMMKSVMNNINYVIDTRTTKIDHLSHLKGIKMIDV